MKKLVFLCSACLLMAACSSQRLTPEQKLANEARVTRQVRDAIDNRTMTIEVNNMMPIRGGMKHLNDSYNIRLSGDTLYSYLPYFGRAYTVPYGGGRGLHFQAPLQDYVVSHPKRDLTVIQLLVTNDEDQYHYMIELYDNGRANLTVRATERDQISFSGEMKLKYQDEK